MRCVLIRVLIAIAAFGRSFAKPSTWSVKDRFSPKPFHEKSRGAASNLCDDTHLHQKDRFFRKPQNMVVKAGDSTLLNCNALEAGEIENIKWIKNSQVIWSKDCWHMGAQDRFNVLGNGTLQIRDTRKTDYGHYECRVDSRLPSMRSSYLLRVHEPLQLTTLPEDGQITVYVGQPLNFGCVVSSGNSTAKVTVNNLNASTFLVGSTNGMVRLDPAQKAHNGLYECRAASNEEEVIRHIQVTVLDPPQASSPARWKHHTTQNTGVSSTSSALLLIVMLPVISTEGLTSTH